MRERLFVKLSTVVMRIISKSFEVSARKVTQRYGSQSVLNYIMIIEFFFCSRVCIPYSKI